MSCMSVGLTMRLLWMFYGCSREDRRGGPMNMLKANEAMGRIKGVATTATHLCDYVENLYDESLGGEGSTSKPQDPSLDPAPIPGKPSLRLTGFPGENTGLIAVPHYIGDKAYLNANGP